MDKSGGSFTVCGNSITEMKAQDCAYLHIEII